MFQVQIFGSFKTGLYLPTRLVIFQRKFRTREKHSLLNLYPCSDLSGLPVSALLVHILVILRKC